MGNACRCICCDKGGKKPESKLISSLPKKESLQAKTSAPQVRIEPNDESLEFPSVEGQPMVSRAESFYTAKSMKSRRGTCNSRNQADRSFASMTEFFSLDGRSSNGLLTPKSRESFASQTRGFGSAHPSMYGRSTRSSRFQSNGLSKAIRSHSQDSTQFRSSVGKMFTVHDTERSSSINSGCISPRRFVHEIDGSLQQAQEVLVNSPKTPEGVLGFSHMTLKDIMASGGPNIKYTGTGEKLRISPKSREATLSTLLTTAGDECGDWEKIGGEEQQQLTAKSKSKSLNSKVETEEEYTSGKKVSFEVLEASPENLRYVASTENSSKPYPFVKGEGRHGKKKRHCASSSNISDIQNRNFIVEALSPTFSSPGSSVLEEEKHLEGRKDPSLLDFDSTDGFKQNNS